MIGSFLLLTKAAVESGALALGRLRGMTACRLCSAALGLVGARLRAALNLIVGLLRGAGSTRSGWTATSPLGVLLLVIAAAFAASRRCASGSRSGEARRAGKYGSSAILATVFAIAILGLLGFLATRYPVRFDWSEQKRALALRPDARSCWRASTPTCEVLALYPAVDAQPVRELLDRYAYASPRFKVEFADPSERPDLLEKYEISPRSSSAAACVRVALGEESTQLTEVTEENLTNAMVKLTRTGEKTVYFLEGHNERAIERRGGGGEGRLRRARPQALAQRDATRSKPLLLASQGEVPVRRGRGDRRRRDAAAARRRARGARQRYLARGGALLVMLDPARQDGPGGRRARLGHRRSATTSSSIASSRSSAAPPRPFAGRYDTAHPITKDLRETTLFHVARSVRPSGEANPDVKELVFTGEDSWAERDLDRFFGEAVAELGADDVKGPVSIAVAAEIDLSDARRRATRSPATPDESKGEGAPPAQDGAGSPSSATRISPPTS